MNTAQAQALGNPTLPSSDRQCIILVLDYAKRFGWSVHLVDVTRQSVSESKSWVRSVPTFTFRYLFARIAPGSKERSS